MNVTLLSGLCIKIVIDYSSTSVEFIYLRMFACIHVRIVIICACQCDSIKKFDDDDDDECKKTQVSAIFVTVSICMDTVSILYGSEQVNLS